MADEDRVPGVANRRTPTTGGRPASTTRRRLLATLPAGLTALAGCAGLFSGGPTGTAPGDGDGDADPDGSSPDTGTRTPAPEGEPEPEPTSEPEATASPAGTATETPPPAPTPTRTAAPAPPGDSLRVDGDRTGLAVVRGDYYTSFRATVTVENTGELVFDRVEFRVDVSYEPPGDEGAERVASAYVERRTFGGDSPETLAPEESAGFVVDPDRLRFERDGRANGSTDVDDFRLDLTFRRVEYRPTATPTSGGG